MSAPPDFDMELAKFRQILGEALAEGGTQPLLNLTDEELAVLDPDSLDQVVAPTPHINDMSTEQREWVLATALRSLVARDLVDIENVEELDAALRSEEPEAAAPLDMRIEAEVELVLTLRRTAHSVLAVEQQTARGSVHAFVYLHQPDLLLIERVTAGGMHLFTIAASPVDAAEMLRELADPFEVADESGPKQQLDPNALDREHVRGGLATAIDNAIVVTQLVVLADEPGTLLTTYASAEQVWTVLVDKPQSPEGVVAREVSRNTLLSMIKRLMTHEPARPIGAE